jgi:protease-4
MTTAPNHPSRDRNVLFIVLFAAAGAVTIGAAILYVVFVVYFDRDLAVGDVVAVVDIHGEIFYDRGKIDEINDYRDNDDVKAVLIHVNSPGGGVAASQALYHAVEKLRAEKPVVVSMASVAASGGYYVACAADSIMAEEGTLTGSIGVIASFIRTEELYRKIGLDVEVIKTGRYKDVGSPHRKMTEAEREYLAGLLDGVYDQFLRAVSESRGIPIERVKELAEGRLYNGEEAVRVGLVDRIGGYEDALLMAAGMGGIEGRPRVLRRHRRRSLLERVIGESWTRMEAHREERISLKYIIP